MSKWSEIFPGDILISRTVYGHQSAAYAITAPVGATVVRVSMVGGGHVHGAAFSRVKTSCTPGEGFTLQIGEGSINGSAASDTVFTRNTGSVVLCRAKAATADLPGQASGGIGDTKRSGSATNDTRTGGDAAGDDADTYPLGYGGPGSFDNLNPGNPNRSPVPGGGGRRVIVGNALGGGLVYNEIMAGDGRATVEFFASDPGY